MAKDEDYLKSMLEADKKKIKSNRNMMLLSLFAGTMFLIAAIISFVTKKYFIGTLDIVASIAQYILAYVNWSGYSVLKNNMKKYLMGQNEIMKQKSKEKELQKEFNFFEKSRK